MKPKKFISSGSKLLIAITVISMIIIATACRQNNSDLLLKDLQLGFYKTDIEFIDCKMNEAFSPTLFNYTANVEKSLTASMYVTPETDSISTGIIKINGLEAKSGERFKVELKPGENIINITVNKQNGNSKSYQLTIIQEDFSTVYLSELIAPGVWRLDDFGGFVGNENMYLIEGKDKALLFDTGMGKGDLAGYVKSLTNLPVEVVITHGHFDHFGQLDQFRDNTVYMSKKEITRVPAELINSGFKWIKDGDLIDLGGGRILEVLELPGHTMGSLLFLDPINKVMVVSDDVGAGAMVWMHIPGCTAIDEYRDGLMKIEEKIKNLDGLTLLVGHHYQEKIPLTGSVGKQFFTDMRILSEKVISGEIIGKVAHTTRNGVTTELRQAHYGLAELWYNPENIITHPASLGFLTMQTSSGADIVTRPPFSSFQTKYASKVTEDVVSVGITPKAYDSEYRSMTINGKPVKSETVHNVKLIKGSNNIDIAVTARDGSVKTYNFEITK
jgi:glyoxylase-like metal-dependent hydrolase (beta-lactamase superfamily II)